MTIFFFYILEIVLELIVIRYHHHYCNPVPVLYELLVILVFRILVTTL